MLPQHLGGVVDSNFLVHGTTNVRVADMSIWPLVSKYNMITLLHAKRRQQLSAHPTATLYGCVSLCLGRLHTNGETQNGGEGSACDFRHKKGLLALKTSEQQWILGGCNELYYVHAA